MDQVNMICIKHIYKNIVLTIYIIIIIKIDQQQANNIVQSQIIQQQFKKLSGSYMINSQQTPTDLQSILRGCLNSNSVQMCQRLLVDYSNKQTFLSQLLQLIPEQNSDEMVIMILSTVKNYIITYYNNPNRSIPSSQKQLLRNNILNLYYTINSIPQAVNLYKQIVYNVISVDYQLYTPLFNKLIIQDLNSSISASVYFSRQIAKFYQWLSIKQRQPLEIFISSFFSQLEQLTEKILTDYNKNTRVLLVQILEMFYSAFHIQVPEYLRDFNHLDKWLLYFRTVFKAPLQNYNKNHVQVSRIYVKLFSMYCRDGTDGKQYKGWGVLFRQKYAQDLYNQIVQILVNPIPDQQLMSNILVCLREVTNNPDMRQLIQQNHCQAIIYKYLLPFMESTSQDYSYFKSDSLQYIRRSQDLTCHPYRRASLDLIQAIAEKFSFGNKSQLIKLIQYAAQVLSNNSNNFNDKQKQVILIVIVDIAPLIIKNKYLKQNFQDLVKQYFLPLLKSPNQILISRTLHLLSIFLKSLSLSPNIISQLMSLLYDKMCSQNMVVRFYAVLAFTSLLDDKQALETARPHFQNILQIYVKLLDNIDHQGLISSLKSIVSCFNVEIVAVADGLVNHLFNMFYSQCNKDQDDNNDGDQDNNQSRQATASLSTINKILQSQLSQQTYYNISEKVLLLLQNLCSEYDDYFQQILNILNTLVYKASNIMNFQFPYILCRKLLEGDNSILNNCKNGQFVGIVKDAQKADTEYSQSLISILKNLIQKMPSQTLHQYPYPTNPQLILSLIQNKKLPSASSLTLLNTSQLDTQWSLIIQSYSNIVYGVGQICQPQMLKMMNGVSLYPWIQYKLNVQVVRKFMISVEDQEGQDQYYEENTVQMLEKFANQDQQDDANDYYISSGGNYGYMYDSPYDSDKDQQHLLAKLRQLSYQQLNYITSQLSNKFRVKLQAMFNNNQ